MGDCWVSFHPAGHIRGSAQVRVERSSDVWVVTGDYKRDPDPTCEPFEPVVCHTLITEATFGLPIYHWTPAAVTVRSIMDWWQWCKEEQTTALLFCYALGKAQRILAELYRWTDEEVLVHGAEVRPLHLVRFIQPRSGKYRVVFVRLEHGRMIPGEETSEAVLNNGKRTFMRAWAQVRS